MQASCFETKISRRDDNSEFLIPKRMNQLVMKKLAGLQNGVKAMIVIAFVVVALVVVYAILYQVLHLFLLLLVLSVEIVVDF